MSSSEEQRLQKEIEQLRTELGETVKALVHKVDLPARAKERGNELTQRAVERGIELQEQVVERGIELGVRVIDWSNELKAQVVGPGSELHDRVIDAVKRGREAASQTSVQRWVTLAGISLLVMIIVRRGRTS